MPGPNDFLFFMNLVKTKEKICILYVRSFECARKRRINVSEALIKICGTNQKIMKAMLQTSIIRKIFEANFVSCKIKHTGKILM